MQRFFIATALKGYENVMIPVHGIYGSARKPALIKDTGYMVEKAYHIAPNLGAFWAYLLPQ